MLINAATNHNITPKSRLKHHCLAYIMGFLFFHFNRYQNQTSNENYMIAGKYYYLEAVQKGEESSDSLSVGVRLPSGRYQRPINKENLQWRLKGFIFISCLSYIIFILISSSSIFIASSLHLHCIFIASSLHLHCICIASSLHLHCIFIASSLHLHCIFIASALHLHCIFISSSFCLHFIFN